MTESLEARLRAYIREICLGDGDEDEELGEITTTGDIAGYETPYAFTGPGRKRKKRKRPMTEEITREDLRLLKTMIRTEVAAIIRDIWIKRSSWA